MQGRLSLTNVFLSPLSTSLLRLIRAISLVCLERGLGLRFPVYHSEPTIDRRALALTLYARVFLSLSPQTCTLCSMFSLDPSVVGLVSLCNKEFCVHSDFYIVQYTYIFRIFVSKLIATKSLSLYNDRFVAQNSHVVRCVQICYA